MTWTKEDVDAYFKKMCKFQCDMAMRANSIEILLNDLLKIDDILKIYGTLKKLYKHPILLGEKINDFNDKKEEFDGLSRNFNELIVKLRKFNKYWNISKHGITVLGSQNLTLYKDGRMYIFDEEKISKIHHCFEDIMSELTEIVNKTKQ